ncbi:hypothetical protein [Streptomyces sp. NPDC051452]|uniref:hypothetical protein n=1 Tax=Streptomyces sp. NPDC051452 TaxID=3365654 RepID=UPI0037BD9A73
MTLDGLLPDITGWTGKEVEGGVALAAELSRWPGGRALNDAGAGEPRTTGAGIVCRFHYLGDAP